MKSLAVLLLLACLPASAQMVLPLVEPPLPPVVTAGLNDQPWQTLLNGLADLDASVRTQAAKGLRDFALQYPQVRRALLDKLEKADEVDSVRLEALKSLSRAGQINEVRDRLLSMARGNTLQTNVVRAMAIKALYGAAQQNDVAAQLLWLLQAADQDVTLRKAAAFALFANPRQGFQDALAARAVDESEDPFLRVECLRSLYAPVAGSRRYVPHIMTVSSFPRTPQNVRVAATLLLHASREQNDVKRHLQGLAENGSAALRAAALTALTPELPRELAQFFHLPYQTRWMDPLENE